MVFFLASFFLSLQKLMSFRYQKQKQMANRTLNFEAGNWNWWLPCNYERKLLIGPEHTLHWIHWHISCTFFRKIWFKTVESYAIWFGLFWYCTLEGTSGVLYLKLVLQQPGLWLTENIDLRTAIDVIYTEEYFLHS